MTFLFSYVTNNFSMKTRLMLMFVNEQHGHNQVGVPPTITGVEQTSTIDPHHPPGTLGH